MPESTDTSVVVVGGGIAGLAVARVLSENGIRCTIVEQNDQLGGNVRDWACMATDSCQRCFCCVAEDMVADVRSSPLITVMEGWRFSSAARTGDMLDTVHVANVANGSHEALAAAALVVATGFEPYDPTERIFWGYGHFDGVLTLKDLDALVRDDDLDRFAQGARMPLRIAFFQCIGSRDSSISADYCSQYCCKAALRMALRLIQDHHDWEITIFYIDLQVAGKYAGSLLAKASDIGIRLIQGVPGEVTAGAANTLEVVREEDGRTTREGYDRIVLSVGQRPSKTTSAFAEAIGLETDRFGFLKSRDFLDSSRTATRGVYLAGTCSGPMDIEQTLVHSGQTASAVIADLQGAK